MGHLLEVVSTIGTVLYAITTVARAVPTKEHDEIEGGIGKLLSLIFCHNRVKKELPRI